MQRLALMLATLLAAVPLLAVPDATGSKDHPLLTRMQNMYIEKYRANPFDRFSFKVAKGQESPVEASSTKSATRLRRGPKRPHLSPSCATISRRSARSGGRWSLKTSGTPL